MKLLLRLTYLLSVGWGALMVFQAEAFSGMADEWIGKAANAAVSYARGDTNSAAQQFIPGANWRVAGPTYLRAGPGGIGLEQRIPPVDRLSNRYINVGGAYNANAQVYINRRPQLSHNVQVSAGNPYLSNTTTLTPPSLRRKEQNE